MEVDSVISREACAARSSENVIGVIRCWCRAVSSRRAWRRTAPPSGSPCGPEGLAVTELNTPPDSTFSTTESDP